MAESVISRVLKYVEQSVGVTVNAHDIAEELNLSIKQTNNAMARLPELNPGIIRVGRGLYRYEGPEVAAKKAEENSTGQLFELVGTTKKGKLILQSDDGHTLYVAQELEVD